MTVKLKIGFIKKHSDPNFLAEANHIAGSMHENENFPNPVPSVEEMGVMLSAFTEAFVISKKGERSKIVERKEKRKVLEEALLKWSRYVTHESNDDLAKAMTSGFQVVTKNGPRPPLGKPIALTIGPGINNGEIICKGKPVPGAASYVFEFATLEGMTTNVWNRILSTKTTVQINNLTRGTLYYCRIGAVGTNGQMVFSDVTSRTAA
jgi:hypothetical protein